MTVWYACVACNREIYNPSHNYCAECWNQRRLVAELIAEAQHLRDQLAQAKAELEALRAELER